MHLVGYNLAGDTLKVKAGAEGEITLPPDGEGYRSRVNMRVAVSTLPEIAEAGAEQRFPHKRKPWPFPLRSTGASSRLASRPPPMSISTLSRRKKGGGS